uniref:Phospholipid-transporting ATPase n=1 Tax=Esox lucius TaxID=8010 RepID=A0A6Q2WW70_ESOLU
MVWSCLVWSCLIVSFTVLSPLVLYGRVSSCLVCVTLFSSVFPNQTNAIKTSKYNVFTFLPLNLFEQFQRIANAYFLILLLLQLIPAISSLSWFTTVVPLVLVLSVTAAKDATDDIVSINILLVRLPCKGFLLLMFSRLLSSPHPLLSFSSPPSFLYSSTPPLRETNLKVKQALTVTGDMGDNIQKLAAFNGEVRCEPPNNRLDRFTGTLNNAGQKYSLDNNRILLRGCTLRNTDWCFGLVLFGGPETKLMKNCGKTTFKRTSVDRLMNVLVLCIFGFLAVMCTILAIGNRIWEQRWGSDFTAFLPREDGVNASFSAFLTFWSYIIILNTVVPISLYVSMEVIRLGNSFYIDWDRNMYHAHSDTPAEARTTTLNEELGQIKYIFSDKTGTLTQNIMTFNKCSINGKSYGEKHKTVDWSFNPLADQRFSFHDHSLVEAVKLESPEVHTFFRLLSLCHTVMAEEKREGELLYQAQSPDEGALVTAARNFGFVFRSRTPESVTVVEMGKQRCYDLLAILDFNNVRKRMSVIVRSPEGKLCLYCKGADTIIYERLHQSCSKLMDITTEHLNEYAGEGLRTLALACKDLDEKYFKEWQQRHHVASTALEDREQKLDLLYEEIEKDLMLLGATAIEDKLQDGVPQTIEQLSQADIKIWVKSQGCFKKIKNHLKKKNHITLKRQAIWGAYALDGSMELLFLRVACLCKTVICCRVTPLQKAQVVELVKKYKQAVTLAIGDGANDVSMIKAAHIGVGISGQEGMQAVLSSDYSFAQFRYLERLLLVHGRWSYLRMCKFLSYFFYKNFTFTFVHLWYAFFCGFSAQTVYDEWFITLYNLVYTALPVLGMSLFDQDVNDMWSFQHPKLYVPGQLNQYFSKTAFFKCALHSVYSSVVLFFIPYAAMYDTVRSDGKDIADYQSFALLTQTCLVFTLGLDMSYWTAVNQLFVWGSLTMYFAVTFAMYSNGMYLAAPASFPFIGTARNSLNQPNVWLTILLTSILCVLPVVAYRFLLIQLRPTINNKVGPLSNHTLLGQAKAAPLPPKRRAKIRRSSTRRSGYAFSHAQGYGDLVTSTRFLRRPAIVPSSGFTLLGRTTGFSPMGRSAGYSPTGHAQNNRPRDVEATSLQMYSTAQTLGL